MKILSSVFLLAFFAIGIPGFLPAQEEGGLTPAHFRANRERFRKLIPPRTVALIFSASEKVRSNDVFYPFHQAPDFYYLTGLNEADALLIIFSEAIEVGPDTVNELIFLRGRSAEYERWNGPRLGTAGAKEELGFSKAFQNTEFADFGLRYDQFDYIYTCVPGGEYCDDTGDRGDLPSMMKHFRLKTDSLQGRIDSEKAGGILAAMREVKSPEELALLRNAIRITCDAQRELMTAIDTTFTEYQAEAVIEYNFRKGGAGSPGFPSIVGGGPNSCVLHYTANNARLFNGDLLVVDVGAEYGNYSADITRTIPVNGVFTKEQKEIYELVLKAQRAGIARCRRGNKFWEPHEAATEIIQNGLKDLGIIKKVYESKRYFMHGTSHYLGLDVHDAGTYQAMKVNSVITVEPGIYIPYGSDCDRKWWNIGVRIEDDILITEGEAEVLSGCVPSESAEIEALMAR